MYKNCLYGTFICVVRKTRCCKILKVKIMGQGSRERRRATCLDDIKEQTQTNLFYCVKHFVVSRIKDISSCVRRRKTNRKKRRKTFTFFLNSTNELPVPTFFDTSEINSIKKGIFSELSQYTEINFLQDVKLTSKVWSSGGPLKYLS